MNAGTISLAEFSMLPPREFVQAAYGTVLGRAPTVTESESMLAAVMQGDARTWLLGTLRYGEEGRRRGIALPGLLPRYVAQRLFRIPVAGFLLQWVNAVGRLPSSLRYFHSIRQFDVQRNEQLRQDEMDRLAALERRSRELSVDVARIGELEVDVARIGELAVDVARIGERCDELDREIGRLRTDVERTIAKLGSDLLLEIGKVGSGLLGEMGNRTSDLLHEIGSRSSRLLEEMERRSSVLHAETEGVRMELQVQAERLRAADEGLDAALGGAQARLDSIFPPALSETLEVAGAPLVALARERAGLAPHTSLASLTPHARYALFESVFYESAPVAAKQRIYVPYLNRELTRQFPFLDLGCGRGEFLQILRGEGIEGVGVDVNPVALAALRAADFAVVEQDLLAFLEADRRTYAGASLLQVAEHLTHDQIERALALLASRLAPGAIFILETPNPLSTFALSVFHTDPTHVLPLPPERMRYTIEAAGFEATRTLFQARIPLDQFAGPDPRAYYADYAIIASRASA